MNTCTGGILCGLWSLRCGVRSLRCAGVVCVAWAIEPHDLRIPPCLQRTVYPACVACSSPNRDQIQILEYCRRIVARYRRGEYVTEQELEFAFEQLERRLL